jgi:hypothetical protein
MNLLVRRRVLWDCLGRPVGPADRVRRGLPGRWDAAVTGVDQRQLSLAFQGGAADARNVLIVDGLHPMHSPAPHSWDVPSTPHSTTITDLGQARRPTGSALTCQRRAAAVERFALL